MAEGLHACEWCKVTSLQLMKASFFLCGKVLFKYKGKKKEKTMECFAESEKGLKGTNSK
jgi:hypothetical protein